jgi:hypothetical protein
MIPALALLVLEPILWPARMIPVPGLPVRERIPGQVWIPESAPTIPGSALAV